MAELAGCNAKRELYMYLDMGRFSLNIELYPCVYLVYLDIRLILLLYVLLPKNINLNTAFQQKIIIRKTNKGSRQGKVFVNIIVHKLEKVVIYLYDDERCCWWLISVGGGF